MANLGEELQLLELKLLKANAWKFQKFKIVFKNFNESGGFGWGDGMVEDEKVEANSLTKHQALWTLHRAIQLQRGMKLMFWSTLRWINAQWKQPLHQQDFKSTKEKPVMSDD